MAPTRQDIEFTALWTRAQPVVASYLAARIPDPHAVDDLLQDVALALLEGFAGYDRGRPFVAWALGVARNKVLMRWRTRGRDRLVIQDHALLDAMERVGAELAPELDRRGQAMRECLGKVRGRALDLVTLRYEQDLEPTAIAGRLGLRADHVRTLLHRVRGSLRACVDRALGPAQARAE